MYVCKYVRVLYGEIGRSVSLYLLPKDCAPALALPRAMGQDCGTVVAHHLVARGASRRGRPPPLYKGPRAAGASYAFGARGPRLR